jgi:hypothetical protein
MPQPVFEFLKTTGRKYPEKLKISPEKTNKMESRPVLCLIDSQQRGMVCGGCTSAQRRINRQPQWRRGNSLQGSASRF